MTASRNPLKFRMQERLTFAEVDQNFANLMRWCGLWVAGTYPANSVVQHEGRRYLATIATTEEPSGITSVDWELITDAPLMGSMTLSAPTAGNDLGAGWDRLTYFDTVEIQGYGVTFDTVGGTFSLDYSGIWSCGLQFSMDHNSLNSGRVINLRVVVAADATEIGRIPIGIGRNVEVTNANVAPWFPIDEAYEGVPLAWELGGGDAVSAVGYSTLTTQIQRIA